MSLARIRTGDQVVVISGKNKGSAGKVLRVWPGQDKVLIEGVNKVKRHTRGGGQEGRGAIVEREAPLHLSKVMLADPESGKPTRVRTRIEQDGSKTRIAVKSGKPIEVPARA